MNRVLLTTAALSVLIGCKVVDEKVDEPIIESSSSTTIDLDYMNTEVRPQDDFFEFANGTWVKNNPVPESESRWGSFNELNQSNVIKLTKILEALSDTKTHGNHVNQLLGDYYVSFKDMDTRNVLGLKPIQGQLDAINKINSKGQIVGIVAEQHKNGIGSLFRFGVGQDMKNVDNNIAQFAQGGLGLPNKEYYFNDDKEEIRTAYQNYIASIMTMLDKSDPDKVAVKIIEFETSLANLMLSPSEMRIPENRYHITERADVIKSFGKFDFEAYLSMTGIASFETMNVASPRHILSINKMIEEVGLEDWKNYLLWKTINHYAGHLDHNFVELDFDFYARSLQGKKEMKPFNERAIEEITSMELGEMLGKAFVEKHYSDTAQARVNELVDNLLIVFQERIENLEWMSQETKKEALNKLNSIGRKLGFPDKWTNFDNLKISRNGYCENYTRSEQLSVERNIAKLGKPVDKEEWGMPAHMVNAYYHPLLNEIAFPAGIMQPPFFDANYEDAVNYGRIGMVIGHEFTHGFDDMGSKFAADGSFTNWWTENDRTLFEERTAKLGNTFANFCPIEGHCVNPQLTMGENIADLGGLTLAYYAYARTEEFKAGIKRKGYSPAQRFFIAYAQLWKINFTDAEMKRRIATDSHSPGMYRVNGPLMNCPEFFEAFGVQESDTMRNSEEEISKIW
ncbi:MAG: putative endopeptidase [Crocinitomicaceae bacterium]|jgi:putative endopeptidase